MTTPIIIKDYTTFFEDLKNRVASSRYKAALSVNKELILLYHHMGSEILKSQERYGWGARIIDQLSKDLQSAFPEMKARYGNRVVAFEKTDPTTEVMAREIFLRCQKALSAYSDSKDQRYPLRPSVKLASVRLWETSSSWAEYWD